MNLIQSLMGRRQFLIATGVASTCALNCKRLMGFQRDAAMAAEKAAMANLKASLNRCPHLLSPLRIRKVVLKNRIMHTQSPVHCLQGPENFPTDAFRNHYSNMAKNAAIVTISGQFGQYPMTYRDETSLQSGSFNHHSDHIWQDIPPVHNYVNRMIEDIHCEGALVSGSGFGSGTGSSSEGGGMGQGGGGPQSQGSGGMPGEGAGGQGGMQQGGEGGARDGGMQGGPSGQGDMQGGGMPQGGEGGMPGGIQGGQGGSMPEGMQGGQGGMQGGGGAPGGGMPGQGQSVNIDDIVAQAKEIEAQGVDVYQMNANSLEAVEAVRAATNLIILSSVGGGSMGGRDTGILHPWTYDGYDLDWQFGQKTAGITNMNRPTDEEIDQVVEAAKKLEGMADIIWVGDARHEHPNSFTQDRERPFSLYYAEAIKKAGVKIVVCPRAGFHNVIKNDEYIRDGITDMVCMTTPLFADPELVKKASEGRVDDITPCISCQDCHGISRKTGPWYDTCNVNPKWGTPVYKLVNIPSPTVSKKVAVIGGGPGGMKAALVAVERGHRVTLFEKSDTLGGLLKFSDHSQWKWTYKDFKDYLVHQVEKAGIEVKLKTTATPSMIKKGGFDTVLVATGAEPVISKMKGADADNVFNILTAYSNKKALGKRVVMIGAGRIGSECAIGMAKDGHRVTILASGKDLIELECIGPHNMMNQIGILQNHPDLDFVLETTVTGITGGKVTYKDSSGKEDSIQADSIVIYSGFKPMMDEAEGFIGAADQVLLLGDCTGKNGTIQKTIRSAFYTASQV